VWRGEWYGHPVARFGIRRSLAAGALVLGAALATLLPAGCRKGRPAIRNVVLISLDTTRADHLGCYGATTGATPHLDALAASGTRFERVVSPVPITLAAHASMLTGLVPPAHGVHDNMNYRLRPSVTTLAEALSAHGLRTAGFVSAFVLDHRFGLAQGFGTWDDTFDEAIRTDFGVERRGSETAAHAVRWLEAHATRPFFLFVHLYDPHAPYDPPEPFAGRFPDNPYTGEIAAADAAVGTVLDALDSLDLRRSTLVVIAGDHGEMLGEHGEPTHTYFVYRSAIRVPLLVAGPGVPAGRTVATEVGLVDIVPTVCGLLGVEPPPDLDGRDLSPWLTGSPPDEDATPYYTESVTPTRYGANPLLGVVAGRWQYIRTTRPELYDLEADPGETRNLFDPHSDTVRRLQGALTRFLGRRSAAALASHATLGRDEEARLQSLGYLGGGVADDLTIDPDRPDPKDLIGLHANNQRAIAAVSAGRLDEAERLYRRILREHPGFVEATMGLARVAMARERWAEAVPLLEQVLRTAPDQYQARYDLGVALTRLGRLDEAVEAFRQAVPHDPQPPDALVNLGRALRKAGRPGKAAQVLERAVAMRPGDAGLGCELAECLAVAGRTGEARTRMETLATAHPGDARVLFDLAQVRLRTGDAPGAVEALRSMLATAPGDTAMRRRAEALLASEGRRDLLPAVLGGAEEAVADEPAAARAARLARSGRLDEAEALLRKHLDRHPDDAGAWLDLGMIALTRHGVPGGLDEAVPLFEKAVALDPSLPEAHLNLGMAWARLGRTDDARRELETALRLARSAGRNTLARRAAAALAALPDGAGTARDPGP